MLARRLLSINNPTAVASASAARRGATTNAASASTPSGSHGAGGASRGRSKPARASLQRIKAKRESTSSSPAPIDITSSTPSNSSAKSANASIGGDKSSTRGRLRSRRSSINLPEWIKQRLLASSSRAGFSDESSWSSPRAKDYAFQPIRIYPEQMKYHKAFTPPHQPIMANLGTRRFTAPPPPADILERLSEAESVEVQVAEEGIEMGAFGEEMEGSEGEVEETVNMDVMHDTTSGQPDFNSTSNGHSQHPFADIINQYSTSTSTSSILAKILSRSTPSGVSDHLNVLRTLSHPSLVHNLAEIPLRADAEDDEKTKGMRVGMMMGMNGADPDSHLARIFAEADMKHKFMAEWEYDAAIRRLGGSASSAETTSSAPENEKKNGQGMAKAYHLSNSSGATTAAVVPAQSIRTVVSQKAEMAEMTDALQGLSTVMDKLRVAEENGTDGSTRKITVVGMSDGGAVVIRVDSVKRKRRKKISKHKYQKRRKATRAQRKRLGK